MSCRPYCSTICARSATFRSATNTPSGPTRTFFCTANWPPFCAARKYSGWVEARSRKTSLAAVGSDGAPTFNTVRSDSSPATKYRFDGCEPLTITMSSVPGASLRTRDHSESTGLLCSTVANRVASFLRTRQLNSQHHRVGRLLRHWNTRSSARNVFRMGAIFVATYHAGSVIRCPPTVRRRPCRYPYELVTDAPAFASSLLTIKMICPPCQAQLVRTPPHAWRTVIEPKCSSAIIRSNSSSRVCSSRSLVNARTSRKYESSAFLLGHSPWEWAFTDTPNGYRFGRLSSLSRTQLSSTSGMCHSNQAIEFPAFGGCQRSSASERLSVARRIAGVRTSKLSQIVCA